MDKEFQKSELPTLFHFVRVRAAPQPHVNLQIMRFRSYVAVSNFPQVLVFFSRRGCQPVAEIERQVM